MANKKVIAVLGATGAQGSGLVRAIMADKSGEFTARALTRNVNSDKAKALKDLGAEVVAADVDNYESLKSAFAGAYGVYAVTFFWEHFSVEKETEEVKMIAKAAKAANIEHIIWSTLEDTRKWVPLSDNRMPTLQGKYKVPHFDGKGEANKFFTEQDLPVTFLLTSFYWDNFIYFGMDQRRGRMASLLLHFLWVIKNFPALPHRILENLPMKYLKKGMSLLEKPLESADNI